MLVLVFRSTNWEKLSVTLLGLPASLVAIVIVVYALGQVFSSLKWWLIARSAGINEPWSKALAAYFFGMFVNCFGFGVLGGDVARGLILAGTKPVKTKALASVIADRLQGLCILALIGSGAVMIYGNLHMPHWLVLALASLGPLTLLGWFLGPWLAPKILPAWFPKRQKLLEVCEAFPRDLKLLLLISLISATFHTLQIVVHRLMADAVGAQVSWSVLFCVIPFVNICATLPISWNGLGVRENAYKFFLVPAILNPEQVIVFGALWIIAMTACSLIGGMIALVSLDIRGIGWRSKLTT